MGAKGRAHLDDGEVALVVREEECQEIENRASKGAHRGTCLDDGLLQASAVESIFRFKCYGCVGA